jgi:gliding motility-associated-like protein
VGPFPPLEDPSFNYTGGAWCTNDVVQNVTITGVPGGTFTAAPAGLSINAATGQITPATSTPGVYDVTYTTPGICFDDSTITVEIYEVPTVDPVLDQTVCVGTDFTAVTFTSPTAGTAFDWTNNNTNTGLVASGNGDIAAFTGQTNGGTEVSTITVTPSTANCTGNPITFDLTVNDLDDASFDYTPGLTYCQTAADPVINITGVPGGTFSYTAVSGGPNLSLDPVSGDITLITSDIGNYDITYNTAGGTGSVCPNTFTLQLAITPGPTADFTLDTYCANDADPLPTFINGGSGGIFSSAPAGLVINPNTGQVDLDASTPGTYTVTNDINVTGCPTATYNDDITIHGLPDASIAGDQMICAGDPINDAVVTLTAGNNTPSWTLNYDLNGAAQGPVVVNAPNTTYNINPTNIGTYTIVSVTDGNGCTNAVTGSVVIDTFPAPTMNPLVDQNVCDGSSIAVQAFGSSVPSTYTWTNLTGTDVGFGLAGTGDIGSFTGINAGSTAVTVNVEVTPTSLDGCIGPASTFNIIVHPRPQVSFFTDSLSGCEPYSVPFINTSNIQGQNCVWDFGNGTTAVGCDTVVNVYTAGVYDVSLTVTTAAGCTDSYAIPAYIEVNEMPEASFTFAPQEITVDNTIVEFTNTSVNASTYLWDFGDNSATSIVESPPHMFPEEPAEYVVTLWAYNGVCEDQYQQLITIKDVIIFYVPNVMTPDGDMFNEEFTPVFTSGFDPFDYHLTIFNRWGEVIFESFNAQKGWNGHYGDGGLVQDGVYIWQIEFKESMSDRRHTHRGHVTVLK